MVGHSYSFHCIANFTFNGVENKSVQFEWLRSTGVTATKNNRITISQTISSVNTFTSTLQFSYLMEGDEGNYTCNVMILRTTEIETIKLGEPEGEIVVYTYCVVYFIYVLQFHLQL